MASLKQFQLIVANSSDFYDAEVAFIIDGNQDGFNGAPSLTSIESNGLELVRDAAEDCSLEQLNFYAGSTHITVDTYAAYGYTPAAVETIDGTNQLAFARTDGYLWKWSLDVQWRRSSTQLIGSNDSGYNQTQIDFDLI